MSAIDEMLAANTAFAGNYTMANLPPAPRKRLAIVACMDARIEPPLALGIKPGDAHIIRNAGGRVVEALRSLAISQQLLGTEEVAIIHHTRCGMATFADDDIRERLRTTLNADAHHIAFLPFRDLEQSVRDDLEVYRQSPIVRHDIPVRGFVYEVETGRLREVE
jgi:carbonic anhydrase